MVTIVTLWLQQCYTCNVSHHNWQS